ncbi:DMT family transporter [Bdellovibrionota bacterium FG-1]
MGHLSGPILITIAALLWGTDSLFRFPTAGAIDPTLIVFIEHAIGLLLLAPWIWSRHRGEMFKLSLKEWLCAFIVGAGGGALATVLFTASFRFLNPSVSILLQKLQPVFTVLLAYALLGERPVAKFYFWALIALGAGFVLSFPDLDTRFLYEHGSIHAKGVIYALSAAGIWSVSTVFGKKLLVSISPAVATFWRYTFGIFTLATILHLAQVPPPSIAVLTSQSMIFALLYLSIVTGLIPMFAYYVGLSKTPAAVATFIELLYPISAVILNTFFLHTPLSPIQMGAGGALLFAITMITI